MSGTKDEDASRAASDSFEEKFNKYIRSLPENPHKKWSKDYFLFRMQHIHDLGAKIDEELKLLSRRLENEPDYGTKYDVGLNFEPEMEEFRKLERMRQSNNNGHPAQEEVGNNPENQNNIATNPDDEKSA